MADRTGAEIFGELFTWAASREPAPERDALARKLWVMHERYDFCPEEMECGEEMGALGLARWGINVGYEEDGECWVYHGPLDPCPGCMVPLFPRVREWRPGLVFSEEAAAWFKAVGKWEEDRIGPCPQPPERTYDICVKCLDTPGWVQADLKGV